MHLFALLYGFVVGATLCVCFFFLLFQKITEFTYKVIDKQQREHLEYTALADEAMIVPPAKVISTCRVACFNGSIVGRARECRAVFYGNSLTIYAIDKQHTLGNHQRVITSEHLLARVNGATVDSARVRLSRYHRHIDTAVRYSPLKGKVLRLIGKNNGPVFLRDAAAELQEKLQGDMARKSRLHGATDASERSHLHHHHHHHHHAGGADDPLAAKEPPLTKWTAVVIKFPTARETERWFNLLQATEQTAQWRNYIKRLPFVDVPNLLIARIFFENTKTPSLEELLQSKITKKLEKVSEKLPNHIEGRISLLHLALGGEIPLFSNFSPPTVSDHGELEVDFDVLYRGGLAFSIMFDITYRKIRVPEIIFHIKVLELSARLRISIGPPPTKKMWLGGPRPPQLRLDFSQEVGSHDGLLNAFMGIMPDMSEVMTNIVKVLLFEDMVFPAMDDFPLPGFD